MKRAPTLSDLKASRTLRLGDGTAVAVARARGVDAALAELSASALGPRGGVTLVAVGGYGRGEMSPHSDVDLLCLVPPRSGVTPATLRGLLYPLWDAGFQVGHAVRTAKEAVEWAAKDLDAATSLLSARFVAGDEGDFEELVDRRRRWLAKAGRTLVRQIVEATEDRHRARDRAGWALAPDLKDDTGGLRDLHALGWLEAVTGEPLDGLSEERCVLLAAREALHAQSKRKLDGLRIDVQPAVAAALGFEGDDGADALMERVHSSARTIEYRAGRATKELAGRGPRRSGAALEVAPGVRLEDGMLALTGPRDAAAHVALLAEHARLGKPLAPKSLDSLEGAFGATPAERWDDATRVAFVRLLAGARASSALELLDHAGAWTALLPEWAGVRGRAQHDPYHRYTVDGHSFLAVELVHRVVAEDEVAAAAAAEAGSIDELLVATLLHDVGKGSGEDHSVAGERRTRTAAARMGFSPERVDEIATLVRRHLLLVDTATRRDLDDGAVIEEVAALARTPRLLRLLYVLTVADARATGPEAWTPWKAALVRELFRKALVALETGELPARSDVATRAREVIAFEPALAGRAEEVLSTLPPSYLDGTTVPETADDLRLLLRRPGPGHVETRVEAGAEDGTEVLTVCVADRPGALAKTAGVLAMNLVTVLRAQAFSTTDGFALQRFVVRGAPGGAAVTEALGAAFSGRLAVDARLTRKALDYRPSVPVVPDVRILEDASAQSTVVEVRAPDALGLLYAITAGLSDLDLDIHVAKIDTLGSRVVDTFYVRTATDEKLGPEQRAEVGPAIAHRVERLFRS
ncbi:MAG TPA: [protein-PII] uridylyltransferase [Actinomycetota bacterium]|nr:[protein-PII] uridylyltransferase [Actinomycetota bacterium]